MTQEQFDDALDDAVYAVLQAFDLKLNENFDTAFVINDALDRILQHIIDIED